MSTTAHNPLEHPISIIRNGVNWTMTKFVGKKEKSKWLGKTYQAPQGTTDGTDSAPVDDKSFVDFITLVGKENIVSSLNAILRRYGQDFVIDSTNPEGHFDLDTYQSFWINLTSASLTKSELEEALMQVTEEFSALSAEMFANLDKMKTDDTYKEQLVAKSTILNARRASIQRTLEERKARRSNEEATETVMAAA